MVAIKLDCTNITYYKINRAQKENITNILL